MHETSEWIRDLRRLEQDARAVFHAALEGVRPDVLVAGALRDVLPGAMLEQYRRKVVVGAGKAAMAMAGAVEDAVGAAEGLVVVPHGYRATLPSSYAVPRRIEVVEAGHPVPDADGVRAADRTLALGASCGAEDLVLVLLSGGGSALWTAPPAGIPLSALQETQRALLRSGAPIEAVNTVRKHLSRISGGRLALAAAPASLHAFVLSDVVGDDLSSIASGPTVPDASTFEDAIRTLQTYGIRDTVPRGVRRHLEQGLRGDVEDTPGPGHPAFERAATHLIGNNRTALAAALAAALARGYAARIVTDRLTGEAREVGGRLVRQVREQPPAGCCCLIWGGEPTVTVTGAGRGGRNQELALAGALALEGWTRPAVLLSAGTDGRDGPTDAAGALVNPSTVPQARGRGIHPAAFLSDNDAFSFFERTGGLLRTGPTHTNVMDVQLLLLG